MRILDRNGFVLWLGLFAVLVVGFYTSTHVGDAYKEAVRVFAVSLLYLAYPVLVIGDLSGASARAFATSCIAAAVWLACVPVLSSLPQRLPESPWRLLVILPLFLSLLHVLWQAARSLTRAETRSGLGPALLTLLWFLVLPWGGILRLQPRVRAARRARATALQT